MAKSTAAAITEQPAPDRPSDARPATGAHHSLDEPVSTSAKLSSRSSFLIYSIPREGRFLGVGWHPHSGIATLTYLWEGSVRYEDTTGAAGLLPAGGVEWFKAAGGAWHGGGAGHSGRTRRFQLWLALAPDQELGQSESIYQKAAGRSRGGTRRRVARHPRQGVEPAPPRRLRSTHLAVRLKAGEAWHYKPPADHTISWASRSPREGSLFQNVPRRAS